jgi:hypothetical protein
MRVFHEVESDNFFDSLTFYTTDEAEIAMLKELAIKIFGQVEDHNVCKKSGHGSVYRMFEYFNNIPDEFTIFHVVCNQNMGTNNRFSPNPYNIKFLVDKTIAQEVYDTTNNDRIRAIAEMILNDTLKINLESFEEYISKWKFNENLETEAIESFKTGTTI